MGEQGIVASQTSLELATQSVILGQGTLAPPGSLCGMLPFRVYPRPPGPESAFQQNLPKIIKLTES